MCRKYPCPQVLPLLQMLYAEQQDGMVDKIMYVMFQVNVRAMCMDDCGINNCS